MTAGAICQKCGSVLSIEGLTPFQACVCSSCGTSFLVPKLLGHLQLEKPIDESGCARLYQGYDDNRNEDVIIMTLNENIPKYAEWVEFLQEDALAVKTLISHENICPLYDYGVIDDVFYATGPIIDGSPLTDYDPIAYGALEAGDVIELFQMIAGAMATAHHKELPHHYLTPENIQIDARGVLRIKKLFYNRVRYMLETQLDLAPSISPLYITPERAQKRPEDKKGDVFQFGVMFYYYLTGVYPFFADNELETVYRRVKNTDTTAKTVFNTAPKRVMTAESVPYTPPASVRQLRPDVRAEFNALILRCLLPYPVSRPTFSEIDAEINLIKAEIEREKVTLAQRSIVRLPTDDNPVMTKTRSIPMMKNLYEEIKTNRDNAAKRSPKTGYQHFDSSRNNIFR